jgi:flagellin
VFGGGTVAIYTGDSSTTGSSIDALNIRSLSSASIGDKGGAMTYSNGAKNVFIDLSTAAKYAQTTDLLAAGGTTSLNVAYMVGSTSTVANATITVTGANNTVQGMITAINNANLGITASFGTAATAGAQAVTAAGGATNGSETGIIISGNVDANGAPSQGGSHVELSQDSTNNAIDLLYDSSVGQTFVAGVGAPSTAAQTSMTQDLNSIATATISYTDSSGQSLSGTDLTNAANAQIALNSLNLAVSDVAAQDGYIGAQINTLNSISQVMTTQMENVVSAQNAIQATDYASATSNMSKYEILSQTGIAALAQANQVEQEVTKLLQ